MKGLLYLVAELLTAPLLALLFGISMIGRAAHATGRFVSDTLNDLEDWIDAPRA